MSEVEYAVVILVVGARLVLPLAIPYFPLPAILACLILDSIDQSIFQQFPGIPLEGYQSYDKALDVYYLTVAFTATMRNWLNPAAFGISRFLYYYRLVGVVLFELLENRTILFLFPNTFEYFFIFYELVRLRWNPMRMSRKFLIWAMALIWVFIKLPQEWWIHIAQLDMTDFIKEEIFGVDKTASWSEAISARPEVIVIAAVLLVALLVLIWWIVTRRCPPADHRLHWRADPLPLELRGPELYATARARLRLLDLGLAEKSCMVALVVVIFAQFLGSEETGVIRTAISVIVFVAANAFVSQLMARRGRSWKSVGTELGVMMVVNLVLAVGLMAIERFIAPSPLDVAPTLLLFFVGLITVMVVLFDRYHTVHVARGLLHLAAPETTTRWDRERPTQT